MHILNGRFEGVDEAFCMTHANTIRERQQWMKRGMFVIMKCVSKAALMKACYRTKVAKVYDVIELYPQI
jgi:hypothetical protein